MITPIEFSLDDQSVAAGYDTVLVPILFEPWAAQLVDNLKPWKGRRVLDLATGTGVVAERLANQVGSTGKVIAADIDGEMLMLARQRCADTWVPVEFVESPAHPLDVSSESVDVVLCQQGFQFFPDKAAAAAEIYRVLRKGGKVVVSTWRSITECEFFGGICDALNAIGEAELSDIMRAPFDFMPESELTSHFETVGFQHVRLKQQQRMLIISGGAPRAIQVAYATPIGPRLRALTEERQGHFRQKFTDLLAELSNDGQMMGRMVSNVMSAEKSG